MRHLSIASGKREEQHKLVAIEDETDRAWRDEYMS